MHPSTQQAEQYLSLECVPDDFEGIVVILGERFRGTWEVGKRDRTGERRTIYVSSSLITEPFSEPRVLYP